MALSFATSRDRRLALPRRRAFRLASVKGSKTPLAERHDVSHGAAAALRRIYGHGQPHCPSQYHGFRPRSPLLPLARGNAHRRAQSSCSARSKNHSLPTAWDLVLSTRSAVLLFYGILALAAMLLRVALAMSPRRRSGIATTWITPGRS